MGHGGSLGVPVRHLGGEVLEQQQGGQADSAEAGEASQGRSVLSPLMCWLRFNA